MCLVGKIRIHRVLILLYSKSNSAKLGSSTCTWDPVFEMNQLKWVTSCSPCSLLETTFFFFSFFANRCSNQGCACWSKRPAVCSDNRAHFVFKSFSYVSGHCCCPRTCCSDNVYQSRKNVYCCPWPQKSSTRSRRVRSTASYDPKTRKESSLPHDDFDRGVTDLPGPSTTTKSVSIIVC